MQESKTLTVQEAAARLRVSVATVRRWLHDGTLRGRRVGPRLLRIETACVKDLETCEVAGSAEENGQR